MILASSVVMKAYGMKRIEAVRSPDSADIARGGLPSRYGRIRNKASVRRHQKRNARRDGKLVCTEM